MDCRKRLRFLFALIVIALVLVSPSLADEDTSEKSAADVVPSV